MDRISFKKEKEQNFEIVHVSGEMDVYNSFEFKELMTGIIDGGCRQVIVDLGRVSYIDSSGLGALISQQTRMLKIPGDFFLVSISDQIRSVLELTKMISFFRIYRTKDEIFALSTAAS